MTTAMRPVLDVHAGVTMRSATSCLQKLSERDSWRLTELPDGCVVDEIRVLDSHGWIQVRKWVSPGVVGKSGEDPVPEGDCWFSGVTHSDIAGAWDGVFEKARRRPDLAWEIRVSEKGSLHLIDVEPAASEKNGKDRRRPGRRR